MAKPALRGIAPSLPPLEFLSADEIQSITEYDREDQFPELIELLDAKLLIYGESGGGNYDAALGRYIQTVFAFLDVLQLRDEIKIEPRQSNENIHAWFIYFHTQLEYYVVAYRIRNTLSGTQKILKLNDRRRNEIYDLLNQIRQIVEGMDIPPAKRETIMIHIARLQKEVDTAKTTLQRGIELVGELLTTAKPLVRYAERLLRAFYGLNEDNKKLLPKPLERLTGPPEASREAEPETSTAPDDA